jgi:hypothetical protein
MARSVAKGMDDPTRAFADVNGLRLYYEIHGSGRPVVLLHGGLLTIDFMFGVLIPNDDSDGCDDRARASERTLNELAQMLSEPSDGPVQHRDVREGDEEAHGS